MHIYIYWGRDDWHVNRCDFAKQTLHWKRAFRGPLNTYLLHNCVAIVEEGADQVEIVAKAPLDGNPA